MGYNFILNRVYSVGVKDSEDFIERIFRYLQKPAVKPLPVFLCPVCRFRIGTASHRIIQAVYPHHLRAGQEGSAEN